MNITSLQELADAWRDEAETLRRRGASSLADLLESVADELHSTLREWHLEMLTLAEAEEESGYSSSTLQQRLASGSLPNAGHKGSPRIRRCDLPSKGGRPPIGAEPKAGDLADQILARRTAVT